MKTLFVFLFILLPILSFIQAYQVSKIKKAVLDMKREMEFECRYIEDEEVRNRILGIFKIMYKKHFGK